MMFNIIMILLVTTMVARSCTGMKYAPVHGYRLCKEACRKTFANCLRGCNETRSKRCVKKLRNCEAKCKKTFLAQAKRAHRTSETSETNE